MTDMLDFNTQGYVFVAAGYSLYLLGLMHGKGHTHWKNTVIAVLAGVAWPISLCYGIYATHFKNVRGGGV